MTRKIKAQAAMEYLMTYGWAILIVVIVAAALYALGIFSPATYTGTRATGFANIGIPSDWAYFGDTQNFNVTLQNSLGQAINITGVSATSGTSDCGNTTGPLNTFLSAGGTAQFGFIACPTLTSGSSYSVGLSVNYILQGGTYPRVDTGTLTGTTV